MNSSQKSAIVKTLSVITFLLMIVVNALANILPINSLTTGQVSDFYPNLFTPSPFTFSIWGLIYFLLACFTIYQLGLFTKPGNEPNKELLTKVSFWFILSSLANIAWIFCWHYRLIPLSMFFMLVILICLIQINNLLREEPMNAIEKVFVRLPFSIYFGWITIATIANLTVLLVSLNWDGFGIPASTWTVLVLLIGALIGILTMLKNKDIAYGLVFVWAYVGILARHISESGFSFQYPQVVYTLIICIILFIVAIAYIFIGKLKAAEK